MKKIFVEMERLRNPFSGLGQFCLHLGKALLYYQPIVGGKKQLDFTFYLPENQLSNFGNEAKYLKVSQWHKILYINGKYDIWHCIHQNSSYLPASKKTKVILTIHDLNFLDRKDYSIARKKLNLNVLQRKIDRVAAITYISNFTRDMVHEYLTIPTETVEKVIYNGNNLESFKPQRLTIPTEAQDFRDGKKPFVFSIGIVQPKKNFHILLPILEKNKDLYWLIGGDDSGKYTDEIKAVAQQKGILERIRFLGKIQESTKYWLYENCEAFLFPSLSEGFGLPIIEAMSLGKPVFLSRLTSLPEIGGNEAYYFNDFSPDHINAVFDKGMKDFREDSGKIERLKQRAAHFSWENAAQEYLDLYVNL